MREEDEEEVEEAPVVERRRRYVCLTASKCGVKKRARMGFGRSTDLVLSLLNRSAKLVSFPWIFHQQLTEVARVLGEAQRVRDQEGWEVGTSTTANGGDEGWDVGP